MDEQNEKKVCPFCGYAMERDTRPLELVYKQYMVKVNIFGWHCPGCGESLLKGDDILAYEEGLTKLKKMAYS